MCGGVESALLSLFPTSNPHSQTKPKIAREQNAVKNSETL